MQQPYAPPGGRDQSPITTSSAIAPTSLRGEPNKWTVLMTLGIGIFMATLDSSIVNISLPTIAGYFHVPLNGDIEWVIIAYLVVIAAVLLTIGRLADLTGRKILFVLGLIVFTLGSAASGAAPTLTVLIIARAFQGLGGALVVSVSPAILLSAFPPEQRGRALGMNALFVAMGTSVGPTLGGLITANFSWRWIFFVNIPLGVIGVIAALVVLPKTQGKLQGRFDPAGALLLAIGLVALTLGLSFGQQWGWGSTELLATLATSLCAFILLIIVERRLKEPLIDGTLLQSRVFVSANVSLVMSFLALFAVSFMLPFYLEELKGYSLVESGLLLTPLPLAIAVIAPFSGMLADRIGSRWLAATGLSIACIGLVFISQLNARSSVPDIIWRLLLTGVGQALFQSPNNSALMGAAPRHRQGVASGFLSTGRVIGQSLSVALAGAIFTSLGGAVAGVWLVIYHASNPFMATDATVMAKEMAFSDAFHTTFLVCASIAAVGIFTSLVRGNEQRKSAPGMLQAAD